MVDRRKKQNTFKSPSESAVETRYLLMPHQVNQYGTAFGGVIMGWIDMAAAMAAQRHCGTEIVTAGIDSIIFKEPIYIGQHVILRAAVNYVGTTSMEVGVQVIREDPYSGNKVVATTAHLTFVAIDKDHRPTKVIPLRPVTKDEKRRYKDAAIRVKRRKQLLKKE